MEESVKERLIRFLKYKGLSQKKFEQECGLSNGYINSLRHAPSATKLQSILYAYPEINRTWLLTGDGDMLNSEQEEVHLSADGIPYYEHLLVTAGESGALTNDGETPTGFINLPAVAGKYCFPVIGCSMEPEIRAGEIVVADDVYSWDRIDPDKVYLIITHEDRMIKHLEVDQEDDSILWCVSPNYKRFSIMKQDIKRIFKITFHGRLV